MERLTERLMVMMGRSSPTRSVQIGADLVAGEVDGEADGDDGQIFAYAFRPNWS